MIVIMDLLIELLVRHHQDVCVSIHGSCDQGVVPEFFINGRLTLWPLHNDGPHNTTYYEISRQYKFCFINVTENIILTEYCYREHSTGCSLCPVNSGEIVFLSQTYISIAIPSMLYNSIIIYFVHCFMQCHAGYAPEKTSSSLSVGTVNC